MEFAASKYLKSDTNGQSSNFVIVINISTFLVLFLFCRVLHILWFFFSFFEMFLLDLVEVLWGQWWKNFLLKCETHNPIVTIKYSCLNKLNTPSTYELLYPFTDFQDPGIGVLFLQQVAKMRPWGCQILNSEDSQSRKRALSSLLSRFY